MAWDLAPGTELGGYLIALQVGRGGMATVYLAEHTALGRKVALKVLSPELAEDQDFRERFIRESKLAAGLEHPNIVPVHDAGEVEGLLYIAMRYVDGSDLKRLLDREITLAPDRTFHILSQVAAALDAAHAKGLIHRDVKPANILLSPGAGPGGSVHAYLTDFGLARATFASSSHTKPGAVYGTLDYMAPEQLEGKPLDARTDVYSLGCVLYECLVGSPPFHRETIAATMSAHLHDAPDRPSRIRGDLPAALDEVILTALAKDKTDRHPSCEELMVAASAGLMAGRAKVVFQLGEGEFPPLKSLNQTNLPVQPTPFLGRERELAEVLDLFRREDVRLLTLTGAGGTGKTRLALQAVAELVEEYPDGVWFVGLAAVMDPGLLLPTIAQTLEVREAAGETLEHALARHLQSKRMVLLLDNVEQLLPSAAPPLGKLCAACPDLELVVTSREPLHLAAEREYPVRPLSNDEALRLFAGRAKAARPGFELRDENRSAVEAICMRLDRLPLAIELAAARVKLLPPDKLFSRLEQRLPVLVGGPRDAPERQRTLRAAIAWSHDLLRDEERVLFARLALFSGGFTLEAAEEVSEADLDTLASLIDKSLLRGEEDGSTEPRFMMLETIREYAVDRLDEQGDAPELRSRHAEFFLSLAEQAQIGLRGPERGSWFERLELETGNFRSAISSSLAQGRIPVALRLVAALTAFWEPRGHWGEARAWLDEVLAQSEGMSIPERARTLFEAGGLSQFQGEIGTSRARLEQALQLAGEVDDRRTLARASARLAWVQVMHGLDVDRAVALGEEGVGVARGLGDPWVLAETLNDLGCAHGDRGHSPRSVNLLEEGLQLRRSIGDIAGITNSLNNLGFEAVLAENYPKAVAYLKESLELARLLTDRPHVVLALDNLALVHLFAGEPAVAEELFSESLRICREIGDRRVAEEVLIGMAGVAALQQAWDRAARLAGAAARMAVEDELVPSAVVPRIEEKFLSAARGALGDELYMAKFDRGRLAPFEEAVAYALSESTTN